MEAFAQWLISIAGDLSVGAILLMIIFVLVFGQQQPRETYNDRGEVVSDTDKWGRPWYVSGGTYRECRAEKRAMQAEIKGYVQDLKDRVEQVEKSQRTRTTRRQP